MSGFVTILILALLALAALTLWYMRKINFSLFSSNKALLAIISLYVAVGIGCAIYLNGVNPSSASSLSKLELEEVYAINDHIYTHASNGEFAAIDQKYIDQQYSYSLDSKQLYIKYSFPEDLVFFVKYIDDEDSNDIKVTTYKNSFVINNVDVTSYKPKFDIIKTEYDELIFTIEESAITIAEVSGQFSVEDVEMFGSSGYSSSGGSHLITIEIPNHIHLLNSEDEFIIVN